MKKKNFGKVASKISNHLSCLDNYSSHPNGRIWVLCDDTQGGIHLVKQHSRFMHYEIQTKHSQIWILATFIFASNDEVDRRGDLISLK